MCVCLFLFVLSFLICLFQQHLSFVSAQPYFLSTQLDLIGSNSSGANQGNSVSLSADGNTLAVGGPFDGCQIGAVWIFTKSFGVWSQQGDKLVASDSNGTDVQQGNSVSLSAENYFLLLFYNCK